MFNKILFLDFDGVMTSKLDGSSYLCGCPEAYRMSDKCKSMLLKLFKVHPDIKVVVHSSWLKFDDPFCATWTSHDGKLTIKSQLWNLIKWLNEKRVYLDKVDYKSSDYKAGRIISWITKNRDIIDDDAKFLILDDDGSRYNMLHMFNVSDQIDTGKYKFIEVNPVTGFNEDNLKEAIKYFPNPKPIKRMDMTLDEAIEHAIKVSQGDACDECKRQHLQLANWLKELKDLRELLQDSLVDMDQNV